MKNKFLALIFLTSIMNTGIAEDKPSWQDAYQFEYSISSYSDAKRLELMKAYLNEYCSDLKCKQSLSHQLSYLFYKRSLKNNGLKFKKDLKKMMMDLKEIHHHCSENCENQIKKLCREYDRKSFLVQPFCLSSYQVYFVQKIK